MTILKVIQIIFSVGLVLMILVQSKGQGLSSGIGNAFSAYRSRRGVERFLFILTIIFSILLVVNSLALLILNR